MAEDAKAFYKEFQKNVGRMQKETPKIIGPFMELFEAVAADGALSRAEKEAVALGIAVAVKCKECIRLHVQKGLAAGLSREQLLEAAAVAVMMGGGPAFVQVPEVMDALDACGAE